MDTFDSRGLKYTGDQVARLLVGTGAKNGPLYRQLSESLAELIDRGELPPMALLPSERALAAALTLSRTTVVTAYQTLRENGRLESRQGSGTRVRPDDGRATVSGSVLAGDHAAAQFLNGPLATIDFATAALPSLELVASVAAGLTQDDYLRLTRAHHGYHLRGLPTLRDRIARWYTEQGLPTAPNEVLVTSGAQQALELVARGCLQPGDGVLVEQPRTDGALQAFSANLGSRSGLCRCTPTGSMSASGSTWSRLIARGLSTCRPQPTTPLVPRCPTSADSGSPGSSSVSRSSWWMNTRSLVLRLKGRPAMRPSARASGWSPSAR